MKEAFLTQKGPKAVGPYSTAVFHAGTAYLSGMVPIDPATGKIEAQDIQGQATQALKNVQTVLGEIGLSMDDVVKATIFMVNLEDFVKVNQIYAGFFSQPYPARSCVQVSALPLGAQIEIEVVAIR